MRLYPQDLGSKWHVALLRRRAGVTRPADADEATAPGLLGRWWTRGSGLAPDAAGEALAGVVKKSDRVGHFLLVPVGFVASLIALTVIGGILQSAGLQAVSKLFNAMINGLLGTGFPLPLLLAWVAIAVAVLPAVTFRRLDRKPLSLTEVEGLMVTRRAAEREYLSLLADALRQPVSAEVEDDLRSAIRALGDALDRLPEVSPLASDNEGLVAEARSVREKAEAETDPVIRASLLRQTEALLRSAEAGERGLLVARRAEALREEMRAQARALRAGIVAYHNTVSDAEALTRLAESVRHVAAEAQSVAAAREEIDSLTAAVASEPEMLRLRQR